MSRADVSKYRELMEKARSKVKTRNTLYVLAVIAFFVAFAVWGN